ncbi:unnamed protein product [Aphanomyces euteiches]
MPKSPDSEKLTPSSGKRSAQADVAAHQAEIAQLEAEAVIQAAERKRQKEHELKKKLLLTHKYAIFLKVVTMTCTEGTGNKLRSWLKNKPKQRELQLKLKLRDNLMPSMLRA